MTMKKTSSKGIPCLYCERDAVPGSDPPTCSYHGKLLKKAGLGGSPKTLKELDAMDDKKGDKKDADRLLE